ncbi:MAG TPA: trypsin-like serine protease [Tepidisphaeraceae bacterium]|nr:trypsin-like serine protease [Tepidisphaeraceae bacterium]
MTRTRRPSTAAALLAAGAVSAAIAVAARQARAGSIRHDAADSAYTSLANEPKYAAAGAVSYLFGFGSGSGTLISPKWVLTAGHVVDGNTTSAHSFKLGPSLTNSTSYPASSYFPHPSWSRSNIIGGFDVGLMKLSAPLTAVAPASRYARADEVGQVGTSVGYGYFGTGSRPQQTLDGRKRAGKNVVDALGPTAYGMSASADLIASDFDDPGNADGRNAFGSVEPEPLEYCIAPGDSGGGVWIDRGPRAYVAAVHSFIHALDPPAGDGTDDASYSDTFGSTRVSRFNAWIDDQITVKWSNASGSGAFATGGNWSGGAAPDAHDLAGFNASGTYAVTFSANISNDRLVARAGDVTLNLGGRTYTLTSSTYEGSLIVGRYAGNAAALTVTNGTLATKESVIADQAGSAGTLSIGAGGTWVVTGDAYVGGSYLGPGGSGTLRLAAGSTTTVSGKLTAHAGGTVHFTGGTLSAAGIALTGGGKMMLAPGANKTLRTGTLTVDAIAGSRLDLADNRLVATAADIGTWSGSSYTGVSGLIQSGRAGGAWMGTGIITSQSAASTGRTSLGVATAGQLGVESWFGAAVSGSHVLVLYTLGGDANLDGKLNGDDYFRIDSNARSPGASGWFNGDFDYNGRLDGDDYFILDRNIGSQATAADVAAVPEPAALAFAAALLAVAVPRHRRRRRRDNISPGFWSPPLPPL